MKEVIVRFKSPTKDVFICPNCGYEQIFIRGFWSKRSTSETSGKWNFWICNKCRISFPYPDMKFEDNKAIIVYKIKKVKEVWDIEKNEIIEKIPIE